MSEQMQNAGTETAGTETAVKRIKQIIYQDENGKEIFRKDKGRGRPPIGSTEQPNGDLLVTGYTLDNTTGEPVRTGASVKMATEIIDLDADGNVVNRQVRGRGRPPKGYEKHEEGEFAGHWVKMHGDHTANLAATNQASDVVKSVPLDDEAAKFAAEVCAEVAPIEDHAPLEAESPIEAFVDSDEWEEVS